jgi:hypothetical protein
MRAPAWVMAAALAALAGGASAATQVVPTVIAGSAAWSKTQPNTVVLNAVVQLNDGCWSNPRFMPPLSAKPPRGPAAAVMQTAPIQILADHDTRKMCPMVVRQVKVPTRNWRVYPNPQLTSVKYIGSAQPVTAVTGKR